MKKTFPEYYPIDKTVVDRIWQDGIFCYDANILLNLYRYSKSTRDKIIENIEHFIDRTIMPYQACYEYLNNRRYVIKNLEDSYDSIIEHINSFINKFESGELSTYRKHCAIDINKDIIKPFKSTAEKVKENIKRKKSTHPSDLKPDEIHDKITSLFEGKVSKRFTNEELDKIYKEGKSRYEKEIPPGFADYKNKKDKNDNHLYGDLIIWKHLIEISKSENKDLIFVTDDRKKDWWDIFHGQTKGPLPALYREFKDLTGHNILIYTAEDYMKYAPEHSEIQVPKRVITEIKDLRETEQNRSSDLRKVYNAYDLAIKNSLADNLKKQTETLQTALNPTKHLTEYLNSITNSYKQPSIIDIFTFDSILKHLASGNIKPTDNNDKEPAS